MEERNEIVNRHISKGMKASKAANMAGFSRSGYYYASTGRKPGKRPTPSTVKEDGTIVSNAADIESVKDIISPTSLPKNCFKWQQQR